MKFRSMAVNGLAVSVSGLALLMSAPVWAQTTPPEQVPAADGNCSSDAEGHPIATDPDCADITGGAAATSGQGGAIVVTGSRVKQPSTYNSISPLQVVTAEKSRDVGEFDASTVLQRSPAAAGQQIDATFGGFVLDNGPGSQTINLRGLGADRTLILINGRRMAPAGVEGAPTNPSINLLPSSLVERYDLLLDGASSVYGSDAIAGVGNIILRKDFKGLELYGEGDINPHGGGDDYTVSAAWGKTFDRGFFGIGAEYAYTDSVAFGDRPFFNNCETHLEVDQNGDFHTIDKRTNALVQRRNKNIMTSQGECLTTNLTGRIFVNGTNYGSVYFTGVGTGNTFIPGFSDNSLLGVDLDVNKDGILDVDFQKQNADFDPTVVLINQQKVYNVMSYGEYSLGGSANITPYFEGNFSRIEVRNPNAGAFQVFPYVPANNAFNPCNFTTNPNGVDCRAAENMRRAALGLPGGLATGNNRSVEPIFSIRGDRSNIHVDLDQYRGVLGVKGDLPFISPSWSFDVAGVYSHSSGTSIRRGIREDKLALALGIDPTADFDGDGVFDNDGDGIADDYIDQLPIPVSGFGSQLAITPCTGTLSHPGAAAPDLLAGCVPVNLFSPSILGQPIGDFATAAERNYVFGDRVFKTTYDQFLVNAYATGELFDMPQGGAVSAVVGGEYRQDKINSRPDFTASNGLLIAFFNDLGAKGKKHVKEAFAELDIPVLLNQPAAQELRINASARITDDQYYGTNKTYSIKVGWRPIEQLLLKMSYGTAFRAPNLRENFLRGQSGFLTLTDPCAVPPTAFQPNPGGTVSMYQPSLDNRDPVTLANCKREGRDPTKVGISPNGLATTVLTSTEISSGGSLDLDPEKSTSFTTGGAFADKWGPFSLNLNVNYYNIQVNNAITEPNSQFIINDCFTRTDGVRSPFCDRITFSNSINDSFLITDIQGGFINFNKEQVRGLDFNASFGYDLQVGQRTVALGLNLQANKLIERKTLLLDSTGVLTADHDEGEFGFPKWTGRATFTAEVDKLTFTWQTRYIGPVEEQADGIDDFTDAFGNNPDGTPNARGFFSDTCLGNGSANGNVPGDGLFCRDVGYAGKYFTHSASIKYTEENWEARVGVSNIFDKAPPRVDGSEVFSVNNVPIGNGYDLDGREFFGSVRYKF